MSGVAKNSAVHRAAAMDSVAQLRKKPRTAFIPSNGSDHPTQLHDRKPHFPAALDNLASDRESTGVGSKTKACLKFFSTSGCPYGESCHFSHYVPGGLASVAFSQPSSHIMESGFMKSHHSSSQIAVSDSQKTQLCKNFGTVDGCRFGDKCLFLHSLPEKESRKFNGSLQISERSLDGFSSVLSPLSQGPSPIEGYKTRLCKNLQSPDGCRFGEKCHFAHGEAELRKSNGSTSAMGEHTPPGLGAAATFGSVSTAKISIDASLAGVIIGKGGINAKAICRVTGAKLFVKDHQSDSSLRNIEMEGSLDQIQQASAMVRELLVHMDVAPTKPGGAGTPNYKTKLCENFAKGSCTYGDRCHFAHGSEELRTAASDC